MSQNNCKWETTISEVAHSIKHEYNEVVWWKSHIKLISCDVKILLRFNK